MSNDLVDYLVQGFITSTYTTSIKRSAQLSIRKWQQKLTRFYFIKN